MRRETKEIYEEAHELQMRLIALLKQVPDPSADQEENADTLYVLKRSAELLKEVRAKVMRKHDVFNTITVAMAAETGELTIRTDWCTVTCSTRVATEVPTLTKSPEMYERFLREVLNIKDQEVIDAGVIQIHYEHWSEYYTSMLGQGKDISPELTASLKRYDASKTVVRKKKDLLESI